MDNAIIIVAVISGIVTLVFMQLDARIFDVPKSKITYAKGMLFGALLGAVIVYFMGFSAMPVQSNMPTFGNSMIDGERILTGIPDF
jgi:hypothetical protein